MTAREHSEPRSPEPVLDQPREVLVEGTVHRVVYANPETAWAVIRLIPEKGGGRVTAVGPLYGIQPGERLRLHGEWVDDRKFGRQLRVSSYLSLEPDTLTGIERYLGSGLVAGIGPVMAKRLVQRFGLETLEVIENEPDRLVEVPGIGPLRKRRIHRAWRQQRGAREISIFLQSHGVTSRQAAKISKHFGDQTLAVLKTNPYRLSEEIFGFGFQTADAIASRFGLARDSPTRAQAGLLHVLTQAEAQGHLFLPQDRLLAAAAQLLGLTLESVRPILEDLVSRKQVCRSVAESRQSVTPIYIPRLLAAEVETARGLRRLSDAPRPAPTSDWDGRIHRFERRGGLQLSDQQREALRSALDEKVLVVTGGPGTGKTTLVSGIAGLLTDAGRRVVLAAPTGRAAKRLSETTGLAARTVHRLLEFDPRHLRFQRHRDRPLNADCVILDEASMLDVPLTRALVEAIPDSSRLILVGDVDQLPSVGPGRVLADVIESGIVPVVRLETVFRQAARSLIVANAHRIRKGQMPRFESGREADFYFIERGSPEDILATLRHLVTTRVPRRFGLDPHRDLQVLAPMRRGLVGVNHLNQELQLLLNSGSPRVEAGRGRFRRGDRVMQIRNNYELEVFNGDIGRIVAHHPDGDSLGVDFDGRRVDYPIAYLDELALAYACSVHKAQGSEYPCVLIPLHSQHHVMLQRNLLYTAVTRGQRLVIIVGERRALQRAVHNNRPQVRFTLLAERLTRLG